ncbi:MAG: nucleotidyl transferase AbiEii/AbiGii toxin family protein [Gammaproteobacteria bacterium]|nr:nucleotidyl transferase AbiEii/AbiGii toxin family protein [Gammaproteobacteria bacterium]
MVAWGISSHEAINASWIFKGGTCLKKCFFETYRFSEDLDFTLADPSHIHENFLKTVFAEIGERIYGQTGIELPSDYQRFEMYENPRGHKCCQGRIGYQGPVSPPGRNMPRIKLDLTADEIVALPPISLPAFHSYSDVPSDDITIRSYAYEEVFGEKVRALAERARPRDLYDVINLFRNAESRPDAAVLRDVLLQKCTFKGIDLPTFDQLKPHRPLLESGWAQMLEHQLPALPPVETFWDELSVFFGWLGDSMAPRIPAAHIGSPGEKIVHARTQLLPISGTVQS